MGMRKVTNLEESPEYEKETLELIESSLGYDKNNQFSIDFYPLFNKDNLKNCFILLEDKKVIGHIGCLNRKFDLLTEHPINMYGGIAIHKDFRGKGLFTDFFHKVLNSSSKAALHFLWSEQLELYEKFNFYPCVELIHYNKIDSPSSHQWDQTKLKDINQKDLNQIKDLYTLNEEIRLLRDDKHWTELSKISSSDLYLKREGEKILNYFFMNKGQDLKGIIHEYGIINEHELSELISFGHLWSPYKGDAELSHQILFGSVARLGDSKLFNYFLNEYAGAEFISSTEDEITVKLDSEEFTLSQKDFLPGILGPGKFKEFETQDLFISGLDSI
tara:strand:+ start:1502 stop:2494 length:993 start_codon:yes stop_codon:yes gene_type:complete